MSASARLVLSCEHAGNEIPTGFSRFFASTEGRDALESHRGWDQGALAVGEGLASVLGTPLVAQRVSRLLVDCNRSLENRQVFSSFSRDLPDGERADAVDRYWRRHRDRVRARVRSSPRGATVVHVGIHTFTPIWKGRARGTMVGLLYDPRRPLEKDLAVRWRSALETHLPAEARPVHLNRPYRGWTDGLTTTLRAELPAGRYVGIELEVSQALVTEGAGMGGRSDAGRADAGRAVGRAAAGALVSALEGMGFERV